MERKVLECLQGKASAEYILPFFWQHGEEHEVLKEEIDAIQNSGISEFCVESRTHEQFGEEKWWQDLGFILDEAKKRNMRVWLLDDKRFPTGYANDYLETHPELKPVKLRMECRDLLGPQKDTALVPVTLKKDEAFVSIVAFRRISEGKMITEGAINLLPCLKDGLLWLDIPKGFWRVYYVIRTKEENPEWKKNYIDMMSAESCKAMLHAVYEPHYKHFHEYFGNTFAGFFSDEPGFGNEENYYHAVLGRDGVLLPWNDEFPEILAEKTGKQKEEILRLLPALWQYVGEETPMLRISYMDTVTECFSKNFSWMLGNWCRDHGVMYIGHIIEDSNAHQRLGYGGGHFFRAMEGQDMAGCDIVLHQMLPGYKTFVHTAAAPVDWADPAFFDYTLPKLAASAAHIQPLKKGRAMCEVYGAFGWATGIPGMKYITDLMLVSGINHFVPHAFTPKYPDPDCPPHFYAGGNNPQYPVFGKLMKYIQRMSHILYGGVHQAGAAVYYNAEAEWAGEKRMLQQEVCKELTQNQIDYDLLPQDTVCNELYVEDGRLRVHEETYRVLVVPYSQHLPEKVLRAFEKLAGEGACIWFLEDFPDAFTIQNGTKKVSFSDLAKEAAKKALQGIEMEKTYFNLRYYHIKRGTYDVYMLWNEDIFEEIDTKMSFPCQGKAFFYDAWKNKAYAAMQQENVVRVRLAPSEAMILCFGECGAELERFDYRDDEKKELELAWKVSICGGKEKSFFPYPLKELKNLAHELPEFAGVIRYETELIVAEETAEILEFENIGEIGQLWINGQECGTTIAKPHRFYIQGKLRKGKNQIRLDVIGNLAYRERDALSTYLPLPAMGMFGKVYQMRGEEK